MMFVGGLGQHPPKGSSCSLTPPTAPAESLQPLALVPSRPSLPLFFSLVILLLIHLFLGQSWGLGGVEESRVGVRVDKGQFYVSVVAVVVDLGWEKAEDYEAKLVFRRR